MIFDVNRILDTPEENLFLQGEDTKRDNLASKLSEIISDMRIVGGNIISENPAAALLGLPENPEARVEQFMQLSRQLLPGFALVSRHDLLKSRWDKMKMEQPSTSLLDAWMDLLRFTYRAKPLAEGEQPPVDGKVEWLSNRPRGTGWIVPISVGYAALSPLFPAGSVRSSRDTMTPFRFVEALHSIGEWVAPHRLTDVDQLLWYPQTEPDKGLYRIINRYTP